ncbi:MAG: hypothetical protein JNL54_13890 [Kineosporiaceae bacterium]|nr:hypothetical protein [Kineosporiaceae bacterium]
MSRRLAAVLLVVAGVAGSLSGCTGDDGSPPDSPSRAAGSSGATSSEGASGAAGSDQSAVVLGYTPSTAAAGTATGRWGQNVQPVTVHVVEVTAGAHATRLLMRLTGEGGSLLRTDSPLTFPTLVDVAGGKVYRVDTFDHPYWKVRRGVLSRAWTGYADVAELTALYPPLASGVDRVEVRMGGFAPVAVPVSR